MGGHEQTQVPRADRASDHGRRAWGRLPTLSHLSSYFTCLAPTTTMDRQAWLNGWRNVESRFSMNGRWQVVLSLQDLAAATTRWQRRTIGCLRARNWAELNRWNVRVDVASGSTFRCNAG